MTAVYDRLKPLLHTDTPPFLGPQRRLEALPLEQVNARLDEALSPLDLPCESVLKIRSLVLLWNDHLEASHSISQRIGDVDGSYVHGIMHRREPDYGNASYWFHRVGLHPCFKMLAERVASLPDADEELLRQLVPGGRWNSQGMIDACEAAASVSDSDPSVEFLRHVQKAEFDLLLQRFASA